MTSTRRSARSRSNNRSTLSRIVTSSFSAGTRKTQLKASATPGLASGARRIARWPRTKRSRLQANIATITQSARAK